MESQNSEVRLYTTPIADPIATEKLSTKLLGLTSKRRIFIYLVAKVKLIRRGVKEVNKAFRKKELG
jgi:hypothetical protein